MRAYAIIKLFIETQKQMKTRIKIWLRILYIGPMKRVATFAIMLALAGAIIVSPVFNVVHADQYQDAINALQAQNSQNKAALVNLSNQADTYQDVINGLQVQIAALQSSIAQNNALRQDLEKQIAEAQAEIERQRDILASDLKAMYVDGTPSSIEILATSKNLSEFVDKQEYRSRVQNKLQDTLKKIAELQKQLQMQKAKVEMLIQELQTQQTQLASDQAKQQELLRYNEQQQASYTAQVRANNAQIAKLQAQQLAAYQKLTANGTRNYGSYGQFQYRNLTAKANCGGGYNYCWAGYNQVVSDSWGLYWARQCVHYAADRAARGINLAPFLGGGHGNAEDWPSSLGGRYAVDHNPNGGRVVAIVAWPDGGGHAMYVEDVLDDGWVHVSQMNWGVNGTYSEMDIKASGVLFIHFP